MNGNKSSPAQDEIRVLEIIGCFLAFFGILLLIAAATGKTTGAGIINLFSGLASLVVGGGMFWRGIARHRAAWLPPVVLFAVMAVVCAAIALCVTRSEPKQAEQPVQKDTEVESLEESREIRPSAFFGSLRRAGSAMKEVLEDVPLLWVKLFMVTSFLVIAAAVWLVRRETVFEGVADRKRWRDLRLWVLVIMAAQVVAYFLLAT